MDLSNSTDINTFAIGDIPSGKDFSINADAAFFDILSNSLYANPLLAVLRETITNAEDANQENGKDVPVEISFTEDSFLLSVTDHGKGIPHDKVHEIYCVYGKSTKQETEVTGGLGLGCKSPFALVDSFTISNCHGGIRRDYLLVKEQGIPKLIETKGQRKDDNTGLTVNILLPRDKYRYRGICEIISSLCFCGGIKAQLNGNDLPYVQYPENRVTYLSKTETNVKLGDIGISNIDAETYVVKYGCNVYGFNSYEIPKEEEELKGILKEYHKYLSLNIMLGYKERASVFFNKYIPVFNVPANSIDITPNRENIRFTKKTINTLFRMIKEEISYIKNSKLDAKKVIEGFKQNRIEFITNVFGLKSKEDKGFTAEGINWCYFPEALLAKAYQEAGSGIEQEFASYALNNALDTSQEKRAKLADLINKFESPLRESLKKAKIKEYWTLGGILEEKEEITAECIENIQKRSDTLSFLLRGLFKVVIISTGKTYDIRCYLSNYTKWRRATQIKERINAFLYPYDYDYIKYRSYGINCKSASKASQLEKELTEKGYYVINLLEIEGIRNSPSKRVTEPREVKELAKRNDTFYVSKEAWDAFNEHKKGYFNLNVCYRERVFPEEAYDSLRRVNNFYFVVLETKTGMDTANKLELKNFATVLSADVKEILEKNSKVRTALGLLYYTRRIDKYRVDIQFDLSQLIWLCLQVPEFCERYSLPVLNRTELGEICLVMSAIDQYKSVKETFEQICPYKGRVGRVCDTLNTLGNHKGFNGLVLFIGDTLTRMESLDKDSMEGKLLMSFLDTLFDKGAAVNEDEQVSD